MIKQKPTKLHAGLINPGPVLNIHEQTHTALLALHSSTLGGATAP